MKDLKPKYVMFSMSVDEFIERGKRILIDKYLINATVAIKIRIDADDGGVYTTMNLDGKNEDYVNNIIEAGFDVSEDSPVLTFNIAHEIFKTMCGRIYVETDIFDVSNPEDYSDVDILFEVNYDDYEALKNIKELVI